jgi:hypothetical protein
MNRFPRLDRGTLTRAGALQPGQRTRWAVKNPKGVARALSIELTAAPDGLTISTGEQVQVVYYWYDGALPHGGLRQFFRCPACERVCRTLYFDSHWACRVCLKLRYPANSLLAGRAIAVHRVESLQRSLFKARPGSRRWHELRSRIAMHHKILTIDVARIRHDLRRRLKSDYKRS